MKVRLKDIAELANVSVAAVSIIINNPDSTRFSDETKENVLRLAAELNYVPNSAAQSLVSNKSKTIGLIIPDLENPFFSSLAKRIEIEFRNYGYTVIMVNTNEDYRNDAELIRFLYGRNVDGMLIALSANTYGHEKDVLEELEKLNIPYVLMDRVLNDLECNQVIFNNKVGQYVATKHLIDRGHTKIGYLSVRDGSLSGYFRHLGYEKAMEEGELCIHPELIKFGSFNYEFGYRETESIVKNGATAIVAANDLIAFGAIKRIGEMGYSVPNDISVVGYDNLEINDMLNNGLSSVDQNTDKLAISAIELLMNVMSGEKEIVKIVLEPRFVERESVKTV